MRISELLRGVDPAQLVDDGDTVTLATGHTVRVSWGPDLWADPMDYVGEGTWAGRVEWSYESRAGYPAPRPAGMDGAAEIIDRGKRGASLWWQPPADVVRGPAAQRNAIRREIVDMFTDGLSTALITLADADGREIEYASLGGITGAYDWYYRVELVGELCDSLAHTVGTRETLTSWATIGVPA